MNLSDRLDGLAAGMLAVVFSVFMVFAFATGYPAFNETAFPYVPKSAEMAVVCAALAGRCVGFLWFNLKKPAFLWAIRGRWRWAQCWA